MHKLMVVQKYKNSKRGSWRNEYSIFRREIKRDYNDILSKIILQF